MGTALYEPRYENINQHNLIKTQFESNYKGKGRE